MGPFDRAWMLRLHREMFGMVWSWAGQTRTTDGLRIGIRAYQIEPALEELARDTEHWRTVGGDLIEQCAMLHWRAVRIHPFLNGNGRWARLLASIWAKQNGGPVTEWPADVRESSIIRATYIAAIQAADSGDMEPIIRLHRDYSQTGAP